MKVGLLLPTLLLAAMPLAAQQPAVVIRDAGPGPVGRYLADLLAKPGTRVVSGDDVTLPGDSTYAGDVVVIANRAEVRGAVEGTVVVVGGDLFVRPGARIGGEGIAIGGGAYGSLLAVVGPLTSHRDFTFDAVEGGGTIVLSYRETYAPAPAGFTLPSLYGLRIPTYDRSNGVSIPIGPAVAVGRGTVDVLATYRSQLGEFDPSATGRFQIGRKTWLDGWAGRESRSNDHWINALPANSLNVLIFGKDERNWYRATGGWATLSRKFETPTLVSTYSLGGSTERSESVRPGPLPTSGPWSIVGSTDDGRMYRPNPQVPGGTITSVIGGAGYRWTSAGIRARLDLDLEVPVSVSTGEKFVQATVDGRIDFPTFGLQKYRLEVHGVITAGDTAPMQRFAYLGGGGTLPTEEIHAFGGGEVLFVESRYEVPLTAVRLPFIGAPKLTFRHILGAAGIQELPSITQIVGVRVSVPFVRIQLLMDTGTKETKFSAGVSLSR